MKVVGDPPLGLNVLPDLPRRQVHRFCDGLFCYAVVEPIEAQIHLLVRERKIKLFLQLRERPCVGRRQPAADDLRHVAMLCQLVDVAFIEMRNRLEIGRTATVLDEKSLIMLKPVRRA